MVFDEFSFSFSFDDIGLSGSALFEMFSIIMLGTLYVSKCSPVSHIPLPIGFISSSSEVEDTLGFSLSSTPSSSYVSPYTLGSSSYSQFSKSPNVIVSSP